MIVLCNSHERDQETERREEEEDDEKKKKSSKTGVDDLFSPFLLSFSKSFCDIFPPSLLLMMIREMCLPFILLLMVSSYLLVHTWDKIRHHHLNFLCLHFCRVGIEGWWRSSGGEMWRWLERRTDEIRLKTSLTLSFSFITIWFESAFPTDWLRGVNSSCDFDFLCGPQTFPLISFSFDFHSDVFFLELKSKRFWLISSFWWFWEKKIERRSPGEFFSHILYPILQLDRMSGGEERE